MKKSSFPEFLCNEFFNFLVSIFGTLLVLLYIGIFFYSFGLPMGIFYSLVTVGFILSVGASLYFLKKKKALRRKRISSTS
jgi:LPXTG-motif cell wall-anchored protein